jgi:hypothetical protein
MNSLPLAVVLDEERDRSITAREDAMRLSGLSVFLLPGALAVLAACASAPPATSPGARYYVAPSEMLEVVGAYPLSNGDVLKVSSWQRRFWAEMRATGRIEIVPVGPGLFVQKDGPVSFQFEELPFTTVVAIGGLGALDAPVGVGGSGIEREFRE